VGAVLLRYLVSTIVKKQQGRRVNDCRSLVVVIETYCSNNKEDEEAQDKYSIRQESAKKHTAIILSTRW
jgi:hypothetical protein